MSCCPSNDNILMINSVKCWEACKGDQALNIEFSNGEFTSDLNNSTFNGVVEGQAGKGEKIGVEEQNGGFGVRFCYGAVIISWGNFPRWKFGNVWRHF